MITWLGAVTPEAFAPTKTLADVVPSVRSKFEALLSYATSLGLKPTIRSAGRTCAQQNEQKEAGYSQASMCRSMHVLGHAIDIDISPSSCANYTKLGEWWEKQGGVWGGRWTQFGSCGDAGHFHYGFDGAGAVPSSVCPDGLSLAECQTLRSEYLTKATSGAPKAKGSAVLTSLAIIAVGVGFVWATLGIKPGKKLLANPTQRLYIDRGYLIEGREVEDSQGNVYLGILTFQVYDESGRAIPTYSYRGEGTHHGDRLVIGDPYKDTQLLEVRVDRQATDESWQRWMGFKQAIEDKREEHEGKTVTKGVRARWWQDHYAENADWWDGYREGWREKRARKKR